MNTLHGVKLKSNHDKCIVLKVNKLRARLVHYNDYYMGIEISITKNTLSWNIISITIH